MYCNQCEQTFRGIGCDKVAVCGKPENVSNLFDLLLWQCQGLSWLINRAEGLETDIYNRFIIEALFLTVTNVNFDEDVVISWVKKADNLIENLSNDITAGMKEEEPECVTWSCIKMSKEEILNESLKHSINNLHENNDIKSLMQLLIYGIRGLAAYAEHAAVLGSTDNGVFSFITDSLAAILRKEITVEELTALNMKCGEVNITCMAMLNKAHIDNYGTPEPTKVTTAKKAGPAIVVSGHDMYMMKQLLEQCDKEGVNVYTHGEMLPAHGYPGLKAHKCLAGHFGTAWQNQQKEFDNQPAVFIFNTNCLQKPKDSYQNQLYTTSVVGWPGCTHIEGYDFSNAIKHAKDLGGFKECDGISLMTGFGHDAVLSHAQTVVDGVKNGAIKRFFLVGGCDGAKPGRNYYTDLVENTPSDTIVLTVACGKFRFNHLQESLGDIAGIPRLLDVGQCNDAYSAVQIALALADAFECSVNELPLSIILSWYEQKAVVVLLSLLHLGIKGIRLGPSLPAFISPNILDFLIENFDIQPIGNSGKGDLEEILG